VRVFERARKRVRRELKVPAWRDTLEKKLREARLSMDFNGMSFLQAVETVADDVGFSLVIDPDLIENVREEKIHLKVTDMPANVTLEWICKLADANAYPKNHALFVTTHNNVSCDVLFRAYDVRDLIRSPRDNPAPELERAFGPANTREKPPDCDEDFCMPFCASDLVMNRVMPDTWAAELGTSVELRGGALLVMNQPYVHRAVERFIADCRRTYIKQVRVEIRLLDMSEKLLAALASMATPGKTGIHLDDDELRLLQSALASGEARLVRSAQTTGMSGQRVHVFGGDEAANILGDGLRGPGIIFDVLPVHGHDATSVTLDVRLLARSDAGLLRMATSICCVDGDSVLLSGATTGELAGRRLVALVRPTLLDLYPNNAPPEILECAASQVSFTQND
jgi:hypothetical protein